MEIYRSLHSTRVRQYSSIGDPVRDREAVSNRWRFVVLVSIFVVGAILLVLLIKRG